MSSSISYDMLTAWEQRRWAIVYLVVGGATPPDLASIQRSLISGLPDFTLGTPAVAELPAAQAPFEVFDSAYILAIKWPVKLKAGLITPEYERTVQGRLRDSVTRPLVESGHEVVQFDFERVDSELTGDRGIPATPPKPRANIPLWPVIPVTLGMAMFAWSK